MVFIFSHSRLSGYANAGFRPFSSSPCLFFWSFLMAYSGTELKRSGDEAFPYFTLL
jgi:hypothetical protein